MMESESLPGGAFPSLGLCTGRLDPCSLSGALGRRSCPGLAPPQPQPLPELWVNTALFKRPPS